MATKERCENCDAPKGKPCPRWVSAEMGFMLKNDATSEFKPLTGCFYKVMLQMMYEVARSVNGAARAVESSRNVIAEGFIRVAPVIAQALRSDVTWAPIEDHAEQLKRLGFDNGGASEGK